MDFLEVIYFFVNKESSYWDLLKSVLENISLFENFLMLTFLGIGRKGNEILPEIP